MSESFARPTTTTPNAVIVCDTLQLGVHEKVTVVRKLSSLAWMIALLEQVGFFQLAVSDIETEPVSVVPSKKMRYSPLNSRPAVNVKVFDAPATKLVCPVNVKELAKVAFPVLLHISPVNTGAAASLKQDGISPVGYERTQTNSNSNKAKLVFNMRRKIHTAINCRSK